MRGIRWGMLGAVMWLFLFALVPPAAACSPTEAPPGVPPPAPPTEAELFQAATIVFEGEVVARTEDRRIATFQVERYFKGEGPREVALRGFGWGTDCLPMAEVGQQMIIYAMGDPQTEMGLLSFQSLAVAPQLVEIAGQEPIEVATPRPWLPPLVGGTLAGLFLLALLAYRDRQRSLHQGGNR